MSDSVHDDDADGAKHAAGRQQADAAARAASAGDEAGAADRADAAARTSPDATANQIAGDPAVPAADAGTADDEDVARISREIVPGSAAPSRAGIFGSESGADGMDQ